MKNSFKQNWRSLKKQYPNLDEGELRRLAILTFQENPIPDQIFNFENLKEIETGQPPVQPPAQEQTGEGIKDLPREIKKRLSLLIKGRQGLPPKTIKNLDKFGDEKVVSAFVHRRPIMSVVERAFKTLSGNYDKIKREIGIDKLFHLGLYLEMENGKMLVFEKLGDTSVELYPTGIPSGGERMEVPLRGKNLKIVDFVRSAENQLGTQRFLRYDAVNSNCQILVTASLRGLGLLTPELNRFINQPVEELFKRLENGNFLRRMARFFTDLEGRIKPAILGGKKKQNPKSLSHFG